jgi:hypothetical protein
MKLDLSGIILDERGNIIKDDKEMALPLYHFVRMATMAQLEEDPKNLEFSRKMQTIFAKLERAKETKIVEFKSETVNFVRERMIKCKFHLLVMRALENLIDGEVTDAALDAI